jgi:hypothetical protein
MKLSNKLQAPWLSEPSLQVGKKPYKGILKTNSLGFPQFMQVIVILSKVSKNYHGQPARRGRLSIDDLQAEGANFNLPIAKKPR